MYRTGAAQSIDQLFLADASSTLFMFFSLSWESKLLFYMLQFKVGSKSMLKENKTATEYIRKQNEMVVPFLSVCVQSFHPVWL